MILLALTNTVNFFVIRPLWSENPRPRCIFYQSWRKIHSLWPILQYGDLWIRELLNLKNDASAFRRHCQFRFLRSKGVWNYGILFSVKFWSIKSGVKNGSRNLRIINAPTSKSVTRLLTLGLWDPFNLCWLKGTRKECFCSSI